MNTLVELPTVEETRDLVPNVPILVHTLFGPNAYFVDWRHSHADWATNNAKRGDGLVWLPWLGQLWLLEVEWKEGSNFFDQSRAFARGKIDSEKLSHELRATLVNFESVFSEALPGYKEGYIVENIIKQTMRSHVQSGFLLPHAWLLLGHSIDNIDKLRNDYEKELRARFTGRQQYILSMARMFRSELSAYVLLEQYCSDRCAEVLKVEPSILVPAVSNVSKPHEATQNDSLQDRLKPKPSPLPMQLGSGGRASEFWQRLSRLAPKLEPNQVKLRIRIDKSRMHDFEVDWAYSGSTLAVISEDGGRQSPTEAVRKKFGNLPAKPSSNVARKRGTFVDVSETPAKPIADYGQLEHEIRSERKRLNK